MSQKSKNQFSEEVAKAAMNAFNNQSVENLTILLGWFDFELVKKAVKILNDTQGKEKKKPKIENYIENILMNSAKVTWDIRGKRHVKLWTEGKTVRYVTHYYFSGINSPQMLGRVKKLVRKVKKRLFQRFYQMPEEKLQQFLASREEKHEG